MKKFKITIYLLIFNFSLIYSQSIGNIKDPDGFTNLREKENSKSRIISSIKVGEEFYYETNNSSNWSKVHFKNLSGYIHNSRIQNIDSISNNLSRFYLEYYKSNKNNTELGQLNNEKLFEFSKKYPLSTLTSFCKINLENQKFIIKQFESPISDLINLKEIYSRLIDYELRYSDSSKIIQAFEYSAKKLGEELNRELINYERTLDTISKSYLSNKKISKAELLKLIPKTHHEFSLYYQTTGPDHILYDTNFFYDSARMIFEQVLNEKNEKFYLPSLKLASYAYGEFVEGFIENLDLIINMNKVKFCESVKEKELAELDLIKYYYELNKCD